MKVCSKCSIIDGVDSPPFWCANWEGAIPGAKGGANRHKHSDRICEEVLDLINIAIPEDAAIVTEISIVAQDDQWLRPWYEASWKDFLLTNGQDKWFLHLGVSD